MKLELQTTSLELSRRLEKLGVKQKSYFHWYQGFRAEWHLGDTLEMMKEAVDVGHMTAPQFVSAAAFTVAELGEMLLTIADCTSMTRHLICAAYLSTTVYGNGVVGQAARLEDIEMLARKMNEIIEALNDLKERNEKASNYTPTDW